MSTHGLGLLLGRWYSEGVCMDCDGFRGDALFRCLLLCLQLGEVKKKKGVVVQGKEIEGTKTVEEATT